MKKVPPLFTFIFLVLGAFSTNIFTACRGRKVYIKKAIWNKSTNKKRNFLLFAFCNGSLNWRNPAIRSKFLPLKENRKTEIILNRLWFGIDSNSIERIRYTGKMKDRRDKTGQGNDFDPSKIYRPELIII